MPDNNNRLSKIFDRWFSNSLTEEDMKYLDALSREPGFRELLSPFLEEQWKKLEATEEYTADQREMLGQSILLRFPGGKQQETMQPAVTGEGNEEASVMPTMEYPEDIDKPSSGRIRFLKTATFRAAAAVLLVSLGAIAYFWDGKGSGRGLSDVSRYEKETNNTEVTTGTEKAILTLADGEEVGLDRNTSGQLAIKGITVEDATISYVENKDLTSINTLATPKGGQYKIRLNDGTMVWLNAASSITYPTSFSGNEREVSISGEVYFEVKHNPTMPFIVRQKNSDTRIEVLGTHFNINAYEDEDNTKVTLLEGSIRVTSSGPYQNTLLRPGQQARIDSSGGVSVKKDADLEEVLAWKNGRFEFNGNNVESVMRQIARWYNVEIEYSGPVPQINFVGAISRTENISQVLKMLEQTKTLHFTIKENKIIVEQ